MSTAAPVSMSQTLVEFAGPDLPDTDDARLYSSNLHIVITAWNLSVAPSNPRITKRFDDALLATTPEVRRLFETKLAELVERKKRLYPNDTRVIAEARLRQNGDKVAIETKSYDYAIHGDKGL